MSNSYILTLREWLWKHEAKIADGVDAYGDLKDVFKYLCGAEPRKSETPNG